MCVDPLLIIMPQYCSVPGCTDSGGHKYPREYSLQLKWRVAVKRINPKTKKLWSPGVNDVVCQQHFTKEDYTDTVLGMRRRLKQDAVPSVFSFNAKEPVLRARVRRKTTDVVCNAAMEIGSEVTLQSSEVSSVNDSSVNEDECCEPPVTVTDDSVQCELLGRKSIENFRNNSKAVLYYTGFQDYGHFMFFFHILGPAVNHLKYKCASLTPADQLFLTVMKLRQARDDIELSFFFEISESTVSQIIITWINFLYFQLKEINIWPSREVIDQFMPDDFGKKFSNTRVILDATETPINKPSNVDTQCVTWSSYKHRNTLKTMIGCTPRGAVSYISDSYGGSVSDRQIIEKSTLLDPSHKMLSKKDSIMADRGIMVQDLFAAQDVFVNTPTMLKGKTQLEPHEVIRDRRVASKRIHIERVIGLSKGYKILKEELPPSKLNLGSRIVYVCFALQNFRKSIVSENA